MKRYGFLILFAFYFAIIPFTMAGIPKDVIFQDDVLIEAFEMGRSLLVAKILSVRNDGEMYYYDAEIVRSIILGDLTEDDIREPLELFAGASYGSALKPGRTYALFVSKSCPYYYSWSQRNDVIEVDILELQALVEAANAAYAQSSIREFREGKAPEKTEPPELPKKIIFLCEEFKSEPFKRADIGKQLYESDLGSRRDESNPISSAISYLQPKIPLSREQMLSLLGRPNLKSGRTYSWLCGQIGKGFGAKEVGVLSATFDKNETAVRVLYQQQDKTRWTKFTAYGINAYVGLCGWADKVLYRFQRALKKGDWRGALSCCSESVKAKAKEYDSLETFFKDFMPLGQITGLSEFRVRGHSGRAGKIIELSFDVPLVVPEVKRPIDWKWSLIRDDDRWLVDFKTLPVNILVKKELLRQELEDEGSKIRIEKIKQGIEYSLIPISEEFVIGRPMLFRVDMVNISNSPILFMHTGSVMVNDAIAVIGPDGENIEYVDSWYSIAVRHEVILPGETITLADNYDVISQYYIDKPGRYTFQFKGRPWRIKPSNTVEVEVTAGELSAADSVFAKILSVLPEGWTATRRLAPSKSFSGEAPDTFICLHLTGKRRGKQIDVDIFIAIGEDDNSLESRFGSELQLWGRCGWGGVYVRVRDAETLWPEYREQIVEALDIEEIKGD